jgi:hypothetical protein
MAMAAYNGEMKKMAAISAISHRMAYRGVGVMKIIISKWRSGMALKMAAS